MGNLIYKFATWLISTMPYRGLHRFVFGDIEQRIYRLTQFAISTAELHKMTFPQFKNKYQGKDIVIVACGPSLNDFKSIPNCIYIGVNRAFEHPKIELDYLFMLDDVFTREEMSRRNNYRGIKCTKFYGIHVEEPPYQDWTVSESDAILANAYRYRVEVKGTMSWCEPKFLFDLSTQPLYGTGSVIFSALQFALWTNPRRIYLAGCDCSYGGGHFYDKSPSLLATDLLIKSYKLLKKFAETYYPDTEIISVNPAGLRGMFKDWNQKDGEPMP